MDKILDMIYVEIIKDCHFQKWRTKLNETKFFKLFTEMVDHKDALIYHAAEFSKIYYITLNNLLNLLGANWGIMLWPSS